MGRLILILLTQPFSFVLEDGAVSTPLLICRLFLPCSIFYPSSILAPFFLALSGLQSPNANSGYRKDLKGHS